MIVVVALALSACAGSGARGGGRVELDVVFTAERDPGDPLEGVRIAVAGEERGVTGPDGTLRVVLEERDGARLAISADCPPGHRSAEATDEIVVHDVQTLAGGAPRVEYPIRCAPTERRVALLVRAGGEADLPVRVGDREVARTDPAGAAQVVLAMAPGSAFRVTLGTGAQPRLSPVDPTHTFTVGDRDEVFVLDQRFEHAPSRRRRPPVAAEPVAPPPSPEPPPPAAPPERIGGSRR
jgi:hypothetical protein